MRREAKPSTGRDIDARLNARKSGEGGKSQQRNYGFARWKKQGGEGQRVGQAAKVAGAWSTGPHLLAEQTGRDQGFNGVPQIRNITTTGMRMITSSIPLSHLPSLRGRVSLLGEQFGCETHPT